ncbi:exported hypothetical protein [Nostocoides jenkinsii Ben 74]|uniref:Uncharacterized protein n=1 Tax=Nostocoides jenkinsii Ben 74 TaxID=1193518 RepID=A0A077MFJ6_9MICO|nr:exported hypothetical protein [Tetrasphaera jenkinsii Ben 74]
MRLRAPSLVGSLAIAAIVAGCSAAPIDERLQPGGSASSGVATAAGIARATPGDVRAISTPSEASTPAFVITPVGRVDLKLSLVRGATLDPDGRREPPAGGAFVVIEATGLPEPMASSAARVDRREGVPGVGVRPADGGRGLDRWPRRARRRWL